MCHQFDRFFFGRKEDDSTTIGDFHREEAWGDAVHQKCVAGNFQAGVVSQSDRAGGTVRGPMVDVGLVGAGDGLGDAQGAMQYGQGEEIYPHSVKAMRFVLYLSNTKL